MVNISRKRYVSALSRRIVMYREGKGYGKHGKNGATLLLTSMQWFVMGLHNLCNV